MNKQIRETKKLLLGVILSLGVYSAVTALIVTVVGFFAFLVFPSLRAEFSLWGVAQCGGVFGLLVALGLGTWDIVSSKLPGFAKKDDGL